MNQVAPVAPKLSAVLADVVRLAQAGMGDEVVLAYIGNLTRPFTLGADEIVYLHDIGVSEAVITALIKRAQTAPAPVEEPAAVAANNPPAEVAAAPVPAVMAEAPPQVTYFYPTLAPYGSWVDVAEYGWCWQPTVAAVDPTWRPYCQRGRWLDTDCGWYWQSDYSWGWAPFHYGRWYYHRHRGWVWMPGSVWSPAWVSWCSAPSYCGWAPLPPEARFGVDGFTYHGFHVGAGFEFGLTYHYYTFLPLNRFCERSPYSHFIWGDRAEVIHRQGSVANHYRAGSHSVVNGGPPGLERQVSATRGEVRKVSVLNPPSGSARGPRPDQLVPTGNSVAIYRPSLPAPLFKDLTAGASRRNQEWRKDTAATAPGAPGATAPQTGGTRPSVAPSVSRQEPGKRDVATSRSGTMATGTALAPMQPAVRPGLETLKAPQPITSVPTPPRSGVDKLRPPQPFAPMQPAVRPGLEVAAAPQPVTSVPSAPRAGIDVPAAPQPISPMQPAVRPGLETPSLVSPSPTPGFNSSYRTYQPRTFSPSQPAHQPQTHWYEPKTTINPGSSYRSEPRYTAPQTPTYRPSYVSPPAATTPSRETTVNLQPRTHYSSPSPSPSYNRPSYSPSSEPRRSYTAPSAPSTYNRPSYHSSPPPQRPSYSAPAPAPRSNPPAYAPSARPSFQPSAGDPQQRSRQENRK